ncbi:replication initiation protein [Ideonella sp. DXS29W]|uniref:Replication initiation protein n=1 Tax=Ideonella lacteola TaxID=2984193 RepID=A0ABU9BW29_9BURK
MNEAPYLARCSSDKTATLVRPREYAVNHPYMQVNRPGMVSWLIFDLDHSNAQIWDDAGLPAPNLIVRNRQSGNSHLYYAIEPVCTSDRARARPIEYMKAIYLAMAVGLRADVNYSSGPVAKTPGHPWWQTTELHAKVFSLGELAEYVELPAPGAERSGGVAKNHSPNSRHCHLFEVVRRYAYSAVEKARAQGSYEHFVAQIEAYGLNSMARVLKAACSSQGDLPWSSIKATARSVARWTWDRYHGVGGVHRGVMQLDDALPLAERQRQAAQRTHSLRAKATESRIRAACSNLQAQGRPLVQAVVAKVAGVSRQTVAAYRHVLEEKLATPAASIAKLVRAVAAAATSGQEQARAARQVKHAVHQVAAAPGEVAKPAERGPLGGLAPPNLPEPST